MQIDKSNPNLTKTYQIHPSQIKLNFVAQIYLDIWFGSALQLPPAPINVVNNHTPRTINIL